MRRSELRHYGDLSMRAFLIVLLLVGALSLIGQDSNDIPLSQDHGMILDQALELDLDDTKLPTLTVFSKAETTVALFSYTHFRQIPEQSSQPVDLSSLHIFQRCSTYRI